MRNTRRRFGVLGRLLIWVVCCCCAFASDARAAEGETQTLIVWGALKRRGLDAAFRKFEQEHPGWQVVTSTAAGAGRMDPQKLMCGIAGGSPPDTLIQDRFSVGEWAIRDAFIPLDDRIKESLRQEDLARAAGEAIAKGNVQPAVMSLRQLSDALRRLGASRQLTIADELLGDLSNGRDSIALSPRATELLWLCQGIRPERFYKACWEEACFGEGANRRAYAIPNSTDARALYYNEDLRVGHLGTGKTAIG
jgi:hypothetical protein